MRKDGREVECDGLEIRYTVFPYRGFESLSFRHVAFFVPIKIIGQSPTMAENSRRKQTSD